MIVCLISNKLIKTIKASMLDFILKEKVNEKVNHYQRYNGGR